MVAGSAFPGEDQGPPANGGHWSWLWGLLSAFPGNRLVFWPRSGYSTHRLDPGLG